MKPTNQASAGLASSAIVFFSVHPDREKFYDATLRRSVLERRISEILDRVEGLRLVKKIDFACAASVIGTSDAINRLRDFVQSQALGTVETDVSKQVIRAAGAD